MHHNDILDDFEFEDGGPDPEDQQGEVVAKFYSELEAQVSAARLRAEGIPCFLANSVSQSILPSSIVMVRLHVHPRDLERARTLLREEMPAPESNSGSISKDLMILFGIFIGAVVIRYLFVLLMDR